MYKVNRKQVFESMVILTIISPILSFQLTFISAVLTYGLNLYFQMRDTERRSTPAGVLVAFLVPLIMAGFLFVAHFPASMSEDFQRTLELCLILSAVVMVFDAVRSIHQREEIDPLRYAIPVVMLIVLFFIARLGVSIFAGGEIDLSRYIDLQNRRNPITGLNPNHADDYFLYGLVVTLFFCMLSAFNTKVGKFACMLFALILLVLFVQAGSLGGLTGMMCGLLLVGLLNTGQLFRLVKRNKVLTISIAALALIGFAIVASQTHFMQRVTAITKVSGHVVQSFNDAQAIGSCSTEDRNARPQIEPEFQASRTLAYRLLMLNAVVEIWDSSPFFGIGVFEKSDPRIHSHSVGQCLFENFAHVHNLYLDILLRGGLALMCLYIATMVTVFYLLFRDTRSNDKLVRNGCMFVVFFFTYLVVENIFDLTFILAATLKANLLGMAALWASTRYRSQNHQ